MQKSIFGKYFTTFLSVMLASIIILGTLIIFLSSRYFRKTQHTLLLNYAKNAGDIVMKNMGKNDGEYIESNIISVSFGILAKPAQIDVALCDTNGKVLIAAGENKTGLLAYNISQDIVGITLNDKVYKGISSLGGMYKEPHYVVTHPVYNNYHQITGFTLTAIDTKESNKFLLDLLVIFLISAAGVIFLATIVIYFLTNKIVRPLREMSVASKSFAKGDFSKKIKVTSYDEVGQLANSFNNMASALSINEEMRRSFVANVSHELKTPMTTIGGFIDGILDGTIPQSTQKKYLRIVSDEVKRLSRLTVAMLNIAKIEAGEMELQTSEFNIMDIIYSTVFSLENKINAKKLDIEGLDVGKFMVRGDADLLHQVIYNIVDNAIKFSNESGYIKFNITNNKDTTFISIKNSGQGISDENQEKIFDRFYKTDKSRSLDKNGVGLGLYIVKTIINMHDGDIIVESKQGEFCEFTFNISSTTKDK